LEVWWEILDPEDRLMGHFVGTERVDRICELLEGKRWGCSPRRLLPRDDVIGGLEPIRRIVNHQEHMVLEPTYGRN
jgi:hypothetical protein